MHRSVTIIRYCTLYVTCTIYMLTKRSEVLDVCLKNYINISEELADRLAAGKPDDGGGR